MQNRPLLIYCYEGLPTMKLAASPTNTVMSTPMTGNHKNDTLYSLLMPSLKAENTYTTLLGNLTHIFTKSMTNQFQPIRFIER